MTDVFGKDTSELRDKKLFLFDMDGTIYEESRVFAGTLEMLSAIRQNGGRYVFITNNSSKSVRDYVTRLTNIGIQATEQDFFTSSQATSLYLNEHHAGKKVYCVGTKSLEKELREAGIILVEPAQAEVLLVGFDTELDYQKLRNACELLFTRQIPFIATNPDIACPASFGFIPDCGSICDLLTAVTKKRPVYIGKPKPTMVELAMQQTGAARSETVVVGDRLYTDIACGVNAGVASVCVLTGEATIEEIRRSDIKPMYTLADIETLYQIFIGAL